MNQSELIAAYEFLTSTHNRIVDIGLLHPSLRTPSVCAQAEITELQRGLLPLIGRCVVEDR